MVACQYKCQIRIICEKSLFSLPEQENNRLKRRIHILDPVNLTKREINNYLTTTICVNIICGALWYESV